MTLLLCVVSLGARAQGDTAGARPDEEGWQGYLERLYENEEESAAAMEAAYEHLTGLAQHPLDVNSVGAEELMLIPGLDVNQINDLIGFRERYGRLRSIDELNMVESIDDGLRDFLRCFLEVKEEKESWRVRQEITATAAIPTYYRAGDRGSGSQKYGDRYLGDPLKHSLRYSMDIGERVTVNLTGAKAAGEPFFSNGNNWGYDRYAFNVILRHLGVVQKVIAGQFRAQFGMGLVMNNNFTVGKQAATAAVGRLATVFSPHSSASDGKYLQGVAAQAKLGDWTVAAFWSYRFIDATLNEDGSIATILTSAYHRTVSEMGKKNDATMMTMGAHGGYRHKTRRGLDYGVGASALYSLTNRVISPAYSKNTMVPDSRLYRFYYPTGDRFWNVSVDYQLRWKDVTLAGETATGGCGGVATLNSLTWEAAKRVTLTAVQRYYAYEYSSLYGSAFSEGGAVQNESGVYVGVKWKPANRLTVDVYSDVAYFPWWKYRVSGSSMAWDNCVTATYGLGKWALGLRYRVKSKQRDITQGNGEKALAYKTDHRLRLTAEWKSGQWTTKSHVEGMTTELYERSSGVIVSQAASYELGRKWTFYVHGAYFNTADYDARLYVYERNVQYSFGYSSFYGKGMRLALMAKAKLGRRLTAMAKVGHTRYFDRETIGTAERMIDSDNQTDIDLQIKIKL